MNVRALTALAPLTLALSLGACGGDAPDADTVVVDPAASTDPAAIEPAPVDPAATDTVVETAVDPTRETEPTLEPATTDTVAVTEMQDDGWTAMQNEWQDSAGIVKDRWAELTEEEILATGGDREQLVSLVQERYGIERSQAEQEVADWAATL